MNELWSRIQQFLDTEAVKLDDPVSVGQIISLVGVLIASFIIAEFLRRWLRRLFNGLNINDNIQNRLVAIFFLIVMIIGVVVAFNIAGISSGFFGKIFNYPLADLFQSSPKQTETDASGEPIPVGTGEDISRLTLTRIFYGFIIVFGMFILSKYAQYILRQQVLQAFQIERHAQFIILRVFHFVLITIGILIALSTLGISFTSIALIFGGLSIGIGFGLQNTVANLISGFILIFERPIKIGDLIEIIEVNIFGRVTSINLRSTVIMALDEKELIVPNSQLVAETIHNLTHYNNRFRVRILVGVSYNSDVQIVKKAMLEAAHEHPEVIKEPTQYMEYVTVPFVRFLNFGESSLDFELLAWIPDSFERFDVASDLHFMIWEKFKEYNIKIPFPQRDVHFYPAQQE